MGRWYFNDENKQPKGNNKPKGVTKEIGMYHQTTVLGNMGGDIEIKASASGAKVGKFSLAVSETFKGEKRSTWYRCTAFNRVAEVIEQYSGTGKRLLVNGRMEFSNYTNKEGVKVNTADLIVSNAQIIDFKEKEESQAAPSTGFDPDSIPF